MDPRSGEDLHSDGYALIAPATAVMLAPHQVLFRHGDPATAFFIVISGWIKLYRITFSGEESVVNVLTRGGSYAEAHALTGACCPATAEAVSGARVVHVPADHVIRCIRENSGYWIGNDCRRIPALA